MEKLDVPFDIIEVIDGSSSIKDVSNVLWDNPVLGIDTESNAFARERGTTTGPHVIQIATPWNVFLFRTDYWTNYCPHRALVKQVMETKSIVKVGFALTNDKPGLRRKLGCELNNMVDIAHIFRTKRSEHPSLKQCVANVLGKELNKPPLWRSNWASNKLTVRQLRYAANDAMAPLQIYLQFKQMDMIAG